MVFTEIIIYVSGISYVLLFKEYTNNTVSNISWNMHTHANLSLSKGYKIFRQASKRRTKDRDSARAPVSCEKHRQNEICSIIAKQNAFQRQREDESSQRQLYFDWQACSSQITSWTNHTHASYIV